MSYDEIEESVADGAPFHLLLFEEGDLSWRFAARAADIVTAGDVADASGEEQTWTAARGLSLGNVVSSPDLARGDLAIVFPLSDSFARRYLGGARQSETALRIWRGHEGEPGDLAALWMGRITDAQVSGETIVLTGQDLLTSIRGAALRRRVQRLCDHTLYGTGCALDIEDFFVAATVTARTGRVYTAAAAGSADPGAYAGGVLRFGSVAAWIEAHDGTALTLSARLPELDAELLEGDVSVEIAPGCDRRRETCIARFDNLENFGGAPDIPVAANNPLNGSRVF